MCTDGTDRQFYYRARYYNPILGRFISRDPLSAAEFREGSNLYAYVGNDPINYYDPDGLEPVTNALGKQITKEALGVVGGVGGAMGIGLGANDLITSGAVMYYCPTDEPVYLKNRWTIFLGYLLSPFPVPGEVRREIKTENGEIKTRLVIEGGTSPTS